jgi:hypothetical protein
MAAAAGHATVNGLLDSVEVGSEAWSRERFDLILCCRTVDHFLDLRPCLDKLRVLLKPDGVLLLDIIDFEVIWDRKGTVESALKLDHCYYLSSENAPHILASAGLIPVAVEIASDPEHVTYVCRPGTPVELPVWLTDWAGARVRRIQESRVRAAYVTTHAALSPLLALRRSLYRMRQKLLRRR